MSLTLNATLDHVAIAVPDRCVARSRWCDELGGSVLAHDDSGVFATLQLRYAGGGKLELLAPSEQDRSAQNFVRRFLTRFGAAVHHVTLKVPDLPAALTLLSARGLDVVDVDLEHEYWREAFLRPSQVGGLVVQVAWSAGNDEEWARRVGVVPEPVPVSGATLLGPLLRHPNLSAARELWTLLGADVVEADGVLRCAWPDSPLTIANIEGAPGGPVALRMSGVGPLEAHNDYGPAVVAGP